MTNPSSEAPTPVPTPQPNNLQARSPSPPSHHNLHYLTATYTHQPLPPSTSTTDADAPPLPPTIKHLTHPLHPCSEPAQHPTTTTLRTLHASLVTLQHELNKLLTAEMVKEINSTSGGGDVEEADEEEDGEGEEDEDEALDKKDELMAAGVGGRGGERQLGGGTGKAGMVM